MAVLPRRTVIYVFEVRCDQCLGHHDRCPACQRLVDLAVAAVCQAIKARAA